MSKKPHRSRFSRPKAKHGAVIESWHNGADVEIHLYAQSLQRAAKVLVEKLDWNEDSKTALDAGPIMLLYRHVVELHLKALVGEGCDFLPSPTDHITLYKTHSNRWLAQIVCQIIRTVRWEAEFKCEGISNLAEFSALVAELEALDPVSCAIHGDKSGRPGEVPEPLRKSIILKLIRRFDALIGLLEATADALSATWDQRISAEETFHAGDNIKPTIQ